MSGSYLLLLKFVWGDAREYFFAKADALRHPMKPRVGVDYRNDFFGCLFVSGVYAHESAAPFETVYVFVYLEFVFFSIHILILPFHTS